MSIFDSIYSLIETYIFGSVVAGSYYELVCILVSTCACLFVMSIPFIIVWRVIKVLLGRL